MALMEIMAEEPQPRTLQLGEISLRFNGIYSPDDADELAEQYLGLISERLAQIKKTYRFSIDGQEIDVDDLYLELEGVGPGSILVKFTLIGTFVLGTYHAVAAYPDFKEGFRELREDVISAVSSASEVMPNDMPEPRRPDAIEVIRREDEELLAELAEK